MGRARSHGERGSGAAAKSPHTAVSPSACDHPLLCAPDHRTPAEATFWPSQMCARGQVIWAICKWARVLPAREVVGMGRWST